MSYVKIDDGMPWHPKVIAVGPVGLALHLAGICRSNQNRSDGLVTHSEARELIRVPRPGPVINRLVKEGLWEKTDDGYQIVNYLQYQRSKADIEAFSEKRRQAGSKGGQSTSAAKQLAAQNSKQKKNNKYISIPGTHDPARTRAREAVERWVDGQD